MIPISIKMTNFQSYLEASLNFDFSSALIVGERDNNSDVSNGSGKSSLLNAIRWALTGKTKQKNSDGVIKRGKDACEVIYIFEHDEKKYKIVRKRSSKYSRTDLMFFNILPSGEEVAIQGDTNTDIDGKIREVIKTNDETFINSCYFMQTTISEFLDGTPATRQKIVGSILDLERWNKYGVAAKSKLDASNKEVEVLKERLKLCLGQQSALQNAELTLAQTQNSLKEQTIIENDLIKEISDLEIKLNNIKQQEESINDYHETVSKLDNVEQKEKELNQSIAKKKTEITHLTQSVLDNERTIDSLIVKINEIASQLQIKERIDLDKMEQGLVKGRAKFEWLTKQILEFKPDDTCLCCGRQWNLHADKVAEIEVKKASCLDISQKLVSLSAKVEAAKRIVENIRQAEIEIEKYTARKKNLETNIEIHQLKKQAAANELLLLDSGLIECVEKKEMLQKRAATMKSVAGNNKYIEIRNLLKVKKEERVDTSTLRSTLLQSIGSLTEQVKRKIDIAAEKFDIESRVDLANKELAIYQNLVRTFGRSGVQAIIVDNVIDELTKVANEWLNEFCYEPTYIRFTTQKKDGKGSWKETLDIDVITPSGTCDFESLSGGEAFRIAFAIRLGLSCIQSRRMGGETQLLLLDEVSTSLDKHGLDLFMTIIRKLEQTMKVMVVTHDDNLKEEFSRIITVRKQGADSTLSIN